jgi:hypothetical protein
MPTTRNLCVLIAEIVGGDRLVTRLGEAETTRAIERCLNRVDLAIGGSGGEILARDHAVVIGAFEQCNSSAFAACEALDRVRKLPPVSGTQMRLRIGLHRGLVDGNNEGEGMDGARLVLLACEADQILASATVVAELRAGARNLASADPFHDDAMGQLPWSVFLISNQLPASPPVASMRPRPEPASPLTTSRVSVPRNPPPRASFPPPQPSSLSPRLRLKHRQETLFSEENRPIVLIGRELGNDIVIIDPRASRQHARIERRRDGFVLIDQSTNGCFVAIDGQEERCIKDDELYLTGAGRIGCGFSCKELEDDIVLFELI